MRRGAGEIKNKTFWVRWGEVCKDKSSGGLGIRDMRCFNRALIKKCIWRFLNEPQRLWVRIIRSRHGDWRSLVREGVGFGRGRREGGRAHCRDAEDIFVIHIVGYGRDRWAIGEIRVGFGI